MEKLIEHHVKYLEIHGVDETVWLTISEHVKLHNRLRRERKCNIPPKELGKIARAAHRRTPKHKANRAAYAQTPKAKAAQAAYQQMPKGKAARAAYKKKNTQTFNFSEPPCPNVQFREQIRYNHKTGSVGYSTVFIGINGHKLPVVDI